MKKSVYAQIISVALLVSVFSGCAASRGFNRGALRESLEQAAVVSDEDIKKALELKPQLPKPFKVGVYFVDSEAHANTYRAPVAWRWNPLNKEKILALANTGKQTGEISEAFLIHDSFVKNADLHSLRLAAAQHGADALLVVSGISDTDSYTNNAAWTYFLILPTLFVPASETDVLFIARASMWDVRNQFLYLTAEAESLNQRTSPLAFVKERDQIETAKNDAVAHLADQLRTMLEGIAHQPVKAKAGQ